MKQQLYKLLYFFTVISFVLLLHCDNNSVDNENKVNITAGTFVNGFFQGAWGNVDNMALSTGIKPGHFILDFNQSKGTLVYYICNSDNTIKKLLGTYTITTVPSATAGFTHLITVNLQRTSTSVRNPLVLKILFNPTTRHIIYNGSAITLLPCPDGLPINFTSLDVNQHILIAQSNAPTLGTVSPSGLLFTNTGASQVYTMITKGNTHLDSVVVGSINKGKINTYTFTNIQGDSSLTAYFSYKGAIIKSSVNNPTMGTISPYGSASVPFGSSKTYVITATPGHSIDSVIVGTVNKGSISNYTFTNITGDSTITAFFSPLDTTNHLMGKSWLFVKEIYQGEDFDVNFNDPWDIEFWRFTKDSLVLYQSNWGLQGSGSQKIDDYKALSISYTLKGDTIFFSEEDEDSVSVKYTLPNDTLKFYGDFFFGFDDHDQVNVDTFTVLHTFLPEVTHSHKKDNYKNSRSNIKKHSQKNRNDTNMHIFVKYTDTFPHPTWLTPVINTPPKSITLRDTIIVSGGRGYCSGSDNDRRDYLSLTLPQGILHNDKFSIIHKPRAYRGFLHVLPSTPAGNYSVKIKATDSKGASLEQDFNVTVTANTAPYDISIGRDTLINGTDTYIFAKDDDNGDSYTLSLPTGVLHNSKFSISEDRHLKPRSQTPLAPGIYQIKVKVVDRAGLSFEKVFTITIIANRPPNNIELNRDTLFTGKATYCIVEDPDPEDRHIFSLAKGVFHNDKFAITKSGTLKINSQSTVVPGLYNVQVTVTDIAETSFQKVIPITIVTNTPPTDIVASSLTLIKGAYLTFRAVDANNGEFHKYYFPKNILHNDSFAFRDQTFLGKLKVKGHVPAGHYTIRIKVLDGAKNEFTKDFNLTVIENNAPSDIILTDTVFEESQSSYIEIRAVDPDTTDAHEFFLIDNDNNFLINGHILYISNPSLPVGKYPITIRAKDKGGKTFEKAFTIAIVNYKPTDITLSSTSVNLTTGKFVGHIDVVDQSTNAGHRFEIIEGNENFTIVTNWSHRLTVSNDNITAGDYPVKIKVTDRDGHTFEKGFTISVTVGK